MGAFCVLYWLGSTINMISLFAFIMTLGILVDDAIIVGENIYTHYERGEPPLKAVIGGMAEVGGPVLMAVSTTVVAFMPLLYISGIMGKFIKILPTAVIIILVVSLFEAFCILPAHLAHSLEKDQLKPRRKKRLNTRLLDSIHQGMQYTIKHIYAPVLRWSLKNRYFTLALAGGVFVMVLGLVAGQHVPFVLFPKTDSNYLQAQISFPLGTPATITEAAIKKIEQAASRLNREFSQTRTDGKDIVLYIYGLVGTIANQGFEGAEIGGHAGQGVLELLPA